MWAQVIQMRLKPGKDIADMAELIEQIQAAEQPGSGLLRSFIMRDAADPNRVYTLVVFESEEQARAREQDPRRSERLAAARSIMADIFEGTPEFTDLATTSPSPHRHLDGLAVAAAVAALTRNVPIATSVVDTVRRHPSLLAQTALTIGHLSRGRFILGLGCGETENTVPYGFDFSRPVSRFEEALPSGRSDASRPDAVQDSVADFWTLLRDLEKKGQLPAEVFALEIGVGSGQRAALWLDRFRALDEERGTSYYPRLRFLLGDYSLPTLDRAMAAVAAHRDAAVPACATGAAPRALAARRCRT